MKKLILVSLISFACLFIGFTLGGFMPRNEKPVSDKSIVDLQVVAYRAMRNECSVTHKRDVCNSVLLHDFYGSLNGESPDPDGYVFVFTNSYLKSDISYAYQVAVRNDGKVLSVNALTPSEVNDIPE